MRLISSVKMVKGVYNERHASVIRYAADASAAFAETGEIRYLGACEGAIDALRLLVIGSADQCVLSYMNGSYLDRVLVGDTSYTVEYVDVK